MPAKTALKASKSQSEKFIQTARAHGADEGADAADRAMKRLAETKPTKHESSK